MQQLTTRELHETELRRQTIHAVQTMRREMTLLADALVAQGAAAANIEMALQSDLSLTEIMAHAPIAETRTTLTQQALAFDVARKAARHAMVAMMLADDFTIADIAKVFGVSRQLASRLATEVRASASTGDTKPATRAQAAERT